MSKEFYQNFIEKEIRNNDVVLFMKGTKEQPRCGFSQTVVFILNSLGIDFIAHDVLSDNMLREEIKLFSDWPTIPQLYVKGEFIGGCDIVRSMYESGELQELFN